MKQGILYLAAATTLACLSAAPRREEKMQRLVMCFAALAFTCLSTVPAPAQTQQPISQFLNLPPLQLQQASPTAPLTPDQEIFVARTREKYPDFYKWLRRQPGMRKPIRDMTEADFQRFRTAFAKWFDARGAFPYGSKQAIQAEEFAIYLWLLMRDGGGAGDGGD